MAKKSGIYTRGGDKGMTSLIGGKRVPKSHSRIEAYGSVDELMAHTSMLRDLVEDESLKEELLHVLHVEMATASLLAVDGDDSPDHLPHIGPEQILFLEQKIDEMDASLEPLNSFLIPGGHPAISQAHITRTVCRRTERAILRLIEECEVDEVIIQYYNRLSDYFFVLSRKIAALLGVQQPPWNSML
jgi:cob(I)alamin adenosyltransferase